MTGKLRVFIKPYSGLTCGDSSTTLHLEGTDAEDASVRVWEIVHRSVPQNPIDRRATPYERYSAAQASVWEWWVNAVGARHPVAADERKQRVYDVACVIAREWGVEVGVAEDRHGWMPEAKGRKG